MALELAARSACLWLARGKGFVEEAVEVVEGLVEKDVRHVSAMSFSG